MEDTLGVVAAVANFPLCQLLIARFGIRLNLDNSQDLSSTSSSLGMFITYHILRLFYETLASHKSSTISYQTLRGSSSNHKPHNTRQPQQLQKNIRSFAWRLEGDFVFSLNGLTIERDEGTKKVD